MIDGEHVKAALATRGHEVVERLFPGGVRRGREWLLGSIEGEPGKSLSICVEGEKAGIWSDFATGEKGTNLLDLWMRARSLGFRQALEEATEWLGAGFASAGSLPSRTLPTRPIWKPYRMDEGELRRCVEMAEALLREDRVIGRISRARCWNPKTIGQLALDPCLGLHGGKLVCIYPTGAKKRLKPLSPALAEGHAGAPFQWMFGKPHALWRGDRILKCTTRIHITEGETAAIALIDAGIGDDVTEAVVATPGASSWRDEWAREMVGRHVTLWPDADAAGEKHAQRITASLASVAASIEIAALNAEEAQ